MSPGPEGKPEPEFRYRLGLRIRTRRDELGLSQSGLAHRLPGAVDGGTISRWELGKSFPEYRSLVALAAALELTEEELLSGR